MFDGEEDDEVSLTESLADSLRDADSTLQVNYPRPHHRHPRHRYQQQQQQHYYINHHHPISHNDKGDVVADANDKDCRHQPSLSSLCMLLLCSLMSKTLLYHALRTLVISTLTKLFKPYHYRARPWRK